MKKIVLPLALAAVMALAAVCGCYAVDGKDGKDGQDLNIYQIYEAANSAREEEGKEKLGFLDFLKEYLNVDLSYSEQQAEQAIMNRSLMSGVALLCRFNRDYFVGSGVIVDINKERGDAYILTNCHVVYDASSGTYAGDVYAYLYGNDAVIDEASGGTLTGMKAVIAGSVANFDLALLKIEGSEALKNSRAEAARFYDGEEVYVGEDVYAIGNPEGAGLSLTRGIISRESESIVIDLSDNPSYSYETEYRVIRTDAAVNGGNSGGGLYNKDGLLIGIINSKAISDEIDNIGYALAGSYAKRVWKLMRDGCTASGARFGLRMCVPPVDYSYTSSAYYDNEKNLAVITDKVFATSSGQGIREGDIFLRIKITDLNGQTVEDKPVTRWFNLCDVLLSARVNYTITYTVLRDGEETEVQSTPQMKSVN